MEAQELMRFHQDGRPVLIVMKSHKPWIMYDEAEHEALILDCSEVMTGVEDFSWALILPFIGQPDFAGPSLHRSFCQSSRFWQNLKVLHNPYQAHICDCSGVITGNTGFWGEGHTDFAII